MKENVGKIFSWNNWKIYLGLVFIIILALVPGVYYYQKYQKAQILIKNPSKVSQEELTQVVEKVGKHILLPVGETPTLATVTNVEKLKAQAFFKDAKNGDKVLIYTKTQKAIIFRPTEDKIVAVAPINLDGLNQKPQPIRIALYNGSKISGLTKKYESLIAQACPNCVISVKANAKNDEYTENKLLKVGKIDQALVKQLSNATNSTVVEKLDGEELPDVDIIIVLGKE